MKSCVAQYQNVVTRNWPKNLLQIRKVLFDFEHVLKHWIHPQNTVIYDTNFSVQTMIYQVYQKHLCRIFWFFILWNVPSLMILNLWSCFHINQVFWAGLFSALWIKMGARSGFCIDVKEPPLLIVIYFSGKSLYLVAVFL